MNCRETLMSFNFLCSEVFNWNIEITYTHFTMQLYSAIYFNVYLYLIIQWMIKLITLPNNLKDWNVFWHTVVSFLSLTYQLEILLSMFMQVREWKFCFYIYVSARLFTADKCKCQFDTYPNIYLWIVSQINLKILFQIAVFTGK